MVSIHFLEALLILVIILDRTISALIVAIATVDLVGLRVLIKIAVAFCPHALRVALVLDIAPYGAASVGWFISLPHRLVLVLNTRATPCVHLQLMGHAMPCRCTLRSVADIVTLSLLLLL